MAKYKVLKQYGSFKVDDTFEGSFVKGTGALSDSISDVDHIQAVTGENIPVSYVMQLSVNIKDSFSPNRYKYTYILSSVGTVSGLGYAFAKKKKFWGYVGFMFLGSIVFGTIGQIIDFQRNNK